MSQSVIKCGEFLDWLLDCRSLHGFSLVVDDDDDDDVCKEDESVNVID
jgi:hypothetical protein